jgi:hypothetical protein
MAWGHLMRERLRFTLLLYNTSLAHTTQVVLLVLYAPLLHTRPSEPVSIDSMLSPCPCFEVCGYVHYCTQLCSACLNLLAGLQLTPDAENIMLSRTIVGGQPSSPNGEDHLGSWGASFD